MCKSSHISSQSPFLASKENDRFQNGMSALIPQNLTLNGSFIIYDTLTATATTLLSAEDRTQCPRGRGMHLCQLHVEQPCAILLLNNHHRALGRVPHCTTVQYSRTSARKPNALRNISLSERHEQHFACRAPPSPSRAPASRHFIPPLPCPHAIPYETHFGLRALSIF